MTKTNKSVGKTTSEKPVKSINITDAFYNAVENIKKTRKDNADKQLQNEYESMRTKLLAVDYDKVTQRPIIPNYTRSEIATIYKSLCDVLGKENADKAEALCLRRYINTGLSISPLEEDFAIAAGILDGGENVNNKTSESKIVKSTFSTTNSAPSIDEAFKEAVDNINFKRNKAVTKPVIAVKLPLYRRILNAIISWFKK